MARLRRFCAGPVKKRAGWGVSQRMVRNLCGWGANNVLRVLAGDVINAPRAKVGPVKYRKAREAARTVAKKK
ncbi:MAG: hypothetical protein ACOYOB_20925 [Myxococcota bacterium]